MRVLVLAAHPRPSESIVQHEMLAAIRSLPGITLRDLYALYPDFAINVDEEQKQLLAHDVIVLQHPVYWYSGPAILKEWMDLVLEHNWAYGPQGRMLHGKFLQQAVSTGGGSDLYQPGARNRYHLRDLFAPFAQTAHLCGMAWLEPFVVYAGRKTTLTHLTSKAESYRDLISGLRDDRIDPLKHVARDFDLPRSFLAARKQKP